MKPPGRTDSSSKIRIRRDMSLRWIWQLVTADGHVAHQSEPFDDRAQCEKEAKQQGLRVDGLMRVRKAKVSSKVNTRATGSDVIVTHDRDTELWQWERVDENDNVVDSSTRAFLTEEECDADAQKNAPLPPDEEPDDRGPTAARPAPEKRDK